MGISIPESESRSEWTRILSFRFLSEQSRRKCSSKESREAQASSSCSNDRSRSRVRCCGFSKTWFRRSVFPRAERGFSRTAGASQNVKQVGILVRGNWIVKRLALFMIREYQRLLSPLLGSRCCYYPTCSDYAYEAVDRYGFFKGSWLAARRLCRCTPVGRHGYDPVPKATHQS